MADYICSSSYFVVSLQSEIFYIYTLHKTLSARGKNLWHQSKGKLTEDWEEINKETCVCNVCLQALSYKKNRCVGIHNFRCKTHRCGDS